jgi:DNA-binding beta-propeller fold protein YncE
LNRFALNVCVAVVMLTGCGGSQPTIGAPGEASRIATHADPGESWMLPEAKSQDLLYVVRGSLGGASVYTYPKGKPVGNITGISAPNGICTDVAGNVFVVGTNSQQIYEYAHGGSTPIATLDDSGNYPQGCAVDPSSGTLAVAGGFPTTANVAIYKNASGTPMVYATPEAGTFIYCTYDDNGNLFMPGGEMFELPKGSSSFLHFFVSGVEEDGQPGIQWDGTYIAMQETGVRRKSPLNIYQIQISGSTGVLVDTLTLTNRSNNSPFRGAQFWIGNGTLVSPEAPNKNVGLWHYPKGGKAYRTIKVNEVGGDLMAVTVSLARH